MNMLYALCTYKAVWVHVCVCVCDGTEEEYSSFYIYLDGNCYVHFDQEEYLCQPPHSVNKCSYDFESNSFREHVENS